MQRNFLHDRKKKKKKKEELHADPSARLFEVHCTSEHANPNLDIS